MSRRANSTRLLIDLYVALAMHAASRLSSRSGSRAPNVDDREPATEHKYHK